MLTMPQGTDDSNLVVSQITTWIQKFLKDYLPMGDTASFSICVYTSIMVRLLVHHFLFGLGINDKIHKEYLRTVC